MKAENYGENSEEGEFSFGWGWLREGTDIHTSTKECAVSSYSWSIGDVLVIASSSVPLWLTPYIWGAVSE